MTGWGTKRFWTKAAAVKAEGGFGIYLDGRAVRTPAKASLILPTASLAKKIVAEWDAQSERVNPETMPATRLANSAIDKVAPQHQAIIDHLIGYAQTDLLCYHAEGPAELVRRQTELWNPLLDWAASAYGVRLRVTSGVVPVDQEADTLAALARPLRDLNPFQLAAFHELVSLPGSFILALAATSEVSEPETLWEISRVDELWQNSHWGEDEEEKESNRRKRNAFTNAMQFFQAADESG